MKPIDLPVKIARYNFEGELVGESEFRESETDAAHLAYFQQKFQHLSGDLELPFEDDLPEVDFVEYRIGSDLKGGYVLYYFHDEVIFASLMLSGTDAVQETELMQVFKFLLLDTQDDEEPSEEMIEQVLSSDEFDFDAQSERPILFEVKLAPSEKDQPTFDQIVVANQAMAVAFFQRCRQQVA